LESVEDLPTELRDVHEETFGDAGIVTCWIEQDYTFEGEPQHVSGQAQSLMSIPILG